MELIQVGSNKTYNGDKHYPDHDYDLFVLYDEEDYHARDDILPRLKRTGLRCCTMEEDGHMGKLTFDVFENLLNRSRKMLFISSKSFVLNSDMGIFSELALKHKPGNIITLITDGQLLYRLKTTIIIRETSENWWKSLVDEINTTIPEYCHFLDTGRASDLLLIRGLCHGILRCELFGLLVIASDKALKVDLQEYSEHRKLHYKYGIKDVCSRCDWLNHIDTTVSIAMNRDFCAHNEHHMLRNDISRLCVAVMNTVFPVCSPADYRRLACSLSGHYGINEQQFISYLFQETRFDLLVERTNKQVHPSFPAFATYKQRRYVCFISKTLLCFVFVHVHYVDFFWIFV